ncbi:unnamed protein product, partial [Mesorhabditis spiculigera]
MSVDVDDMTDEDFLRAMEDLPLNDKTEIGELLKAMNENHMITWEEAERIMADANDEPIKCSLVEQTRPTEPDNETNVDKCIQQLQSNDPDLTQINLNNMKRTPVPQLRRLIEAMAYNEHLEKLSLANMGLYDHDVAILIEAIRLNQHLKHINLETNYLSGEFFSGLFEAALENESIEEIKAVNQGVSFSTEAEKNIIKAIQKNHGLCKVSLTLRLPEGRHKIEQTTLRNGEIRRILRRKQREEEEAKRKAEQGTMPSKGTEPKIGVQAMKLTPKPSGTAPMILAETSKPKPKPVDKFNKFMERARPEMEFDTEPVYATPKTDPTVIKKTESVRKPEPKPEVKPEPKKLDPFKPQGQEKKGEIKMVVAKKKQAVSQAQETRAALPRPEVTPETKGTAPMILAEEPEPSKSDQHVCDILEVHPSERKALQLPEQEQDQTIQGLKAEKKPKKKHTTDILELPEVHRKKELKLTEVDQEAKVQTKELPLSPEPIKKATAEKLEPTPTTPKAEKKLKKKTPEPVVRIQTDSPVSVASTTEASSSSAPKTKAGVEKKENGKLVAGPKKAKVDEAKKDASPVRPSWRREKKADAPKPEVSNVEAAQPEVPKAAEPSSKTEEVAQEVDAKLEIQKVEDSGVEPKPEVSEVAPVVEQQEDHKVEAPSENGDLKVEDPKEAREASPIVPKKMYTVEQASISSSVREPQNGVPWRSRGALSPTKPKKSPSPGLYTYEMKENKPKPAASGSSSWRRPFIGVMRRDVSKEEKSDEEEEDEKKETEKAEAPAIGHHVERGVKEDEEEVEELEESEYEEEEEEDEEE